MPLDPSAHRPDIRLRRPLRPEGEWIRTPHLGAHLEAGWGISGQLVAEGETIAAHTLHLGIEADGVPVELGEAFWRPSGATVHGTAHAGGLQVVRDAFVTDDRTVVCVLWVRNASSESIRLDLEAAWGFRDGQFGDSRCIQKVGPPLDDLRSTVPPGGRGKLVFASAIGNSPQHARSQAEYWCQLPNAYLTHRMQVEAWFFANAPRFACDDPWLELLWMHGTNLRREGVPELGPPGPDTVPGDAFADSDPDRPNHLANAWSKWIRDDLVGLKQIDGDLEVDPLGDAAGLAGWCLDAIPAGDRRVTIAWDDPKTAPDRYDDGCQGFSVHVDGRLEHRSDRPQRTRVAIESRPNPWSVPDIP